MCVIFSKRRQEYNSLNHWLIFTLLIFRHGSAIIHLACDKHCSKKTARVNCIHKILFIFSLTSFQNSSSRAADWIRECVDITNLSLIFLMSGFGKHLILSEVFLTPFPAIKLSVFRLLWFASLHLYHYHLEWWKAGCFSQFLAKYSNCLSITFACSQLIKPRHLTQEWRCLLWIY